MGMIEFYYKTMGIGVLDGLRLSNEKEKARINIKHSDEHSRNLSFDTVETLSNFQNCANELNSLFNHLGDDCHPLGVLKTELESSQKLSGAASRLKQIVKDTSTIEFEVDNKKYSSQQLINEWSKKGVPSRIKLKDNPDFQNLRSAFEECISQSERFKSRLSPKFDRQSLGQSANQDQKGYRHRMSTQMKIVEAMNDLQTRPIPSNLSEQEKKDHIENRKRVLEELNKIYQAQAAVIPNDNLLRGRFRTVSDETSSGIITRKLGHSSLKSYSAKEPLIKPCTLVNTGVSSCITKSNGPNGKKSARTDTTGLSIDQMKKILDQLQNQGFSVNFKVTTKGGVRKLDYKIVGPGHKDLFQKLVSDAKTKNESKKTETATLKTENQPKSKLNRKRKRTGALSPEVRAEAQQAKTKRTERLKAEPQVVNRGPS